MHRPAAAETQEGGSASPGAGPPAGRARRPPDRSALRRALPVIRLLVGLGLAAVAVVVLLGRKGELSGSAESFRHIRLWWLAPAALVESISMLCFALILGRLLSEARRPIGLRALIGITLASNSIANSLPAGPAFGAAYSYRRMRALGVPDIVAAWAMLAAGVLAGAALAVIAVLGVAVALGQGSAFDLVGVSIGTLVVALLLIEMLRRPSLVVPLVRLGVAVSRAVVHRPAASPAEVGRTVRRRLEVVTPGWPGLVGALGWALGNWGFDLCCLVFAFGAVGSPVPWRGVLLAYGAAQLASNLPITPGGLGVVEGSLTIGLVAYGGAQASSVAAVLVYRVLSFWLPLLIGWVVAGLIALESRRAARIDQESEVTP